jgi:hypothetical protein
LALRKTYLQLKELVEYIIVYKIIPRGIRIPVASVKGRRPRPLDDGDLFQSYVANKENTIF